MYHEKGSDHAIQMKPKFKSLLIFPGPWGRRPGPVCSSTLTKIVEEEEDDVTDRREIREARLVRETPPLPSYVGHENIDDLRRKDQVQIWEISREERSTKDMKVMYDRFESSLVIVGGRAP